MANKCAIFDFASFSVGFKSERREFAPQGVNSLFTETILLEGHLEKQTGSYKKLFLLFN